MRVLMVPCDLRTGGAEMAALDLIRALRGRCEFFIAPVRGGGELGEAFVAAGATVCAPLARWRYDPGGPFRLAGHLTRHAIDALLVVDVARNAMFHARAGATLCRRRIARVCWCHSVPSPQAGRFVPRLRRAQQSGRLEAIVLLSRSQRDVLIAGGVRRRGTVVIPNGVDLSAARTPRGITLRLPPDKTIVVQVANVMRDKDFPTLLDAVGRLARTRDDFHLVLVGRGTDSPAMAREVRRAGLEPIATLAGCRDDVPGILAAADVFVLATRSEVFNRSALEAMAAGLPLVVSDVPGFSEVFTDEREGLKVAPQRPAALFEALDTLLGDAALRDRMSRAARLRARNFSRERMAEAFERLLTAAVAQVRGRR
ncbi:MAG: glycosyltransferase [Phycisphaerae bacterium]|nr:glycosyltransferase [Phycisphaerae bacterium]